MGVWLLLSKIRRHVENTSAVDKKETGTSLLGKNPTLLYH